MKHLDGRAGAVMQAPIGTCFSLLEAVERYPSWCGEFIREVSSVERGDDGRPVRAHVVVYVAQSPFGKRFEFDATIRTEPPRRLNLSRLPGSPDDRDRFSLSTGRSPKKASEPISGSNSPRRCRSCRAHCRCPASATSSPALFSMRLRVSLGARPRLGRVRHPLDDGVVGAASGGGGYDGLHPAPASPARVRPRAAAPRAGNDRGAESSLRQRRPRTRRGAVSPVGTGGRTGASVADVRDRRSCAPARFPRRLPRAHSRCDYGSFCGRSTSARVLEKHLQCVAVREPLRMRLAEVVRADPRIALDGQLPPELGAALARRAAERHRPPARAGRRCVARGVRGSAVDARRA